MKLLDDIIKQVTTPAPRLRQFSVETHKMCLACGFDRYEGLTWDSVYCVKCGAMYITDKCDVGEPVATVHSGE